MTKTSSTPNNENVMEMGIDINYLLAHLKERCLERMKTDEYCMKSCPFQPYMQILVEVGEMDEDI